MVVGESGPIRVLSDAADPLLWGLGLQQVTDVPWSEVRD